MELRQLKYFVAAAETLNFTAAAKKCYVTQSSLSQQIKQLENEWNIALFTRQNNTLTLTKAGEKLLKEADEILYNADKAEYDMLHFSNDPNRDFCVGYSVSSFGLDWSAPLRSFIETYPGIYIRVIQDEPERLSRLLKNGDLDVILAFPKESYDEEEWMEFERIYTSHYLLLCAEGKYDAPSGSEVELSKEYPLRVFTSSDITWRGLLSFVEAQTPGAARDVMRYNEGGTILVPELLSGEVTVLLPDYLLDEMPKVRLNHYRIKGLNLKTGAFLIRNREDKNNDIGLMVNFCRKYFDRFSGTEEKKN